MPIELNPVEFEVIALFTDFAHSLDLPKSLGAIYGALFISSSPLNFNQISERLQISAGSLSQGLRQLRTLGAVKSVFIPGERRDYFTAETGLKQLISGIFQAKLDNQLREGVHRVEQLQYQLTQMGQQTGDLGFLVQRLTMIEEWLTGVRQTIPQVVRDIDA